MKQILSVADQAGPLLQAARKSAGLSQTALARRLGISQSRMSAMELDPGSISLAQLLAMCSALRLELLVQTQGHSGDDRSETTLTEPEW
jgi:HTH-type transcriptional regulator/antitoxin HipB